MCMAVSALLLMLLVSGVLVYLSSILKKEAELAAYVLPNLELAHQFSSATSGLQSQGLLLRSAATTDELFARNELLENSIRQTRALLESGHRQQDIDTSALTNTIDQIHVIVIALFDIRNSQLEQIEHLQQETNYSLVKLDNMLGAIQSHVVKLTDQLLEVGDVLSAITATDTGESEALESYVARLREFESNSLKIQEFMLFSKDLEKLRALVQTLPLLRTSDAVTLSIQERDLLVQTMNQRTEQIQDNEVQDLLLLPLSRINSRLHANKNPFDSTLLQIELSQLQTRLGNALTVLTDEVPAVAEQIRSQSEALLVSVFEETTAGLERYRWTLLGGLGFALGLLGTVSYWLVYRQTVIPLEQISGQLDSVGTDGFTSSNQPYFIQEMSDLSVAVNDLDQAHKAMQRKDVQLKVTNKELRRANEDLEQFAHVASHDLQEPLRMLQQFSGLLEEDYQSELDDDGKFYIEAITSSARRMSSMIRDTLEYASSSRTSRSLTTVDLEQTLAQVIRDKEIAIHEAGATITVSNLPCVIANATGMTQLFGNLLINAIKYRREGVPSLVTVDAHYPPSTPVVEITVRDNGVGMESKYLERIFSPFERLGGNTIAGTGLGLAICTKVCESHAWEIDVSSEVDRGSSFRIRVPLTQVVKLAA